MVDLIKFLRNDLKMKEIKEYCNKYISEGLEVGKKYSFLGIDKDYQDIHYIITSNIKKGLFELWNKYNFNIEEINKIFVQTTWNMDLFADYELISVWETIGRYDFKRKIRKNASISNSTFTLEELPHFDFIEENIEELTIKEYIIKKLKEKKENIIERFNNEIIDLKQSIKDCEDNIKKYQDINLNIASEDEITEWCDECGMESVINKNGGYCEHCGKYLLPCSLCDMDKVDCNNCKYKK